MTPRQRTRAYDLLNELVLVSRSGRAHELIRELTRLIADDQAKENPQRGGRAAGSRGQRSEETSP